MMNRTTVYGFFLVVCISLICLPVRADDVIFSKTYPLPITEAENVILAWLRDSDFKILQKNLEFGQVNIAVSNREEFWGIDLSPGHLCATEITIFEKSPDEINMDRLNHLWNYIAEYLNSPAIKMSDGSHGITTDLMDAVVCIEAKIEGEAFQSTGFIIDKNGLIITTAHDLENPESVSVILYDGSELTGSIKKADYHRDLALIRVDEKLEHSISLSTGRSLLEMCEKLYSVSCPYNHKKPVSLGYYTKPGQLFDLILLQSNMRIYLGNSGSPVFDAHGNLVAIVKGRNRRNVSVGYLIPLETIVEFVQEKQ